MKSVKYIWILLVFFPLVLEAQQEDLPTEQIEVIRSFDARLLDAEKLTLNPTQVGPDTTRQLSYTYRLNPRPYAVTYSEPEIRPIAMRKESLPDFYNGFLRMGYGFPNSPLLEAGYHINERNNLSLGFTGRHLSANNKDISNQKFRETHAAVFGQYVLNPYITISADAALDIDDYYYYATNFLEDTTINENILKRYTNLSAEATLFNSVPNRQQIDYFGKFKLNRLSDNRASRENNVLLHFGAKKWLGEQHPLGLEIGTDFTNLRDTLVRSLNNFFIKPTFTYFGDRFSAMAGLNLSSSKDEFYFFPLARVDYRIAGQTLIGYAGVDGDLYKNHYTHLSSYNPFINHRLDTLGNTTRVNIYAGAKGLYRQLAYSAELRYQNIERMAFYLPNSNLKYLFDPIFDETRVISFQASLEAEVYEGLRVQTELNANFFNLKDLEEAWHIPTFIWTLSGFYRSVDDRLHLRSSLFVESGIQTLNEEGESEKLKGLFDFNVGADYFISENFALFLNVQNLLNNKRQRWANYPSHGINAHAGLFLRL